MAVFVNDLPTHFLGHYRGDLDMETGKVGKRGTVVIPAALRRQFGIEEGSLVVAEATDEGVLIRPAVAVPVEMYSAERKAALLLENATDGEDYERAAQEVRAMGIDPESLGVQPPEDDGAGTGRQAG